VLTLIACGGGSRATESIALLAPVLADFSGRINHFGVDAATVGVGAFKTNCES
jgi:hypothetical protein